MDTFEIGDKVVYPNHGVGIIEKISNRLVAGKFERFYLLRICSNDILVMVPTANANDVGLRKIIDRRDVEQLFQRVGPDDAALAEQRVHDRLARGQRSGVRARRTSA